MSQSPNGASEAQSMPNRTGPGSLNTNNKNAIKISADGVAKLTFSFLDDHHADSSLEPGEVKTPPHSPISVGVPKEPPALKTSVVPKSLPPLHNEFAARPAKSLSQLEAQACQEKVRAILELDAIKRREEADKRKLRQLEEAKMLLEQKRGSGEEDEDEEAKRKAKEERKRLKKLKKEKKAALELLDEEEDEECTLKKKKKKKPSRDYSSEDESAHGDNLRPLGNLPTSVPRYAIVPTGPPPHMPPFPDQYMGFRGMNPFMRGPRPDFHHPRGGFHPRMRGGMRGVMRFPGFRPPFFGGMQRHHNQLPRQQTPPTVRGHSPIQAPTDNLIWTTTKPSISYAFNTRDDYKSDEPSKTPEEHSPSTKTDIDGISSQRSGSKQSKKSKKSREHEKIKKRRTSRNSSEKSSKKKIEKIRKSMDKYERKRTKTPDFSLLGCGQKTEELKDDGEMQLSKRTKLDMNSDGSEEMWDIEEKTKNLAQTIKKKESNVITFKIETKQISDENNLFENNDIEKLKDDPLTPEGPALPPNTINKDTEFKTIDHGRNFDMFADSPPRSTSPHKPNKVDKLLLKTQKFLAKTDQKQSEQNVNIKKEIQSASNIEDASGTPPTSLLKQSLNISKKPDSEKTPLERAIEMQSRIDKLLKEDDLDPLTISRIKAKSLEYKRHKEEALSRRNQKESVVNQKQIETQKATTPEQPKPKNPFKRSNSRDRYSRRSRSRTPKRDTGSKQSSLERNRSESRSKNRASIGSSGSLNRSGSGSLNSSKTDSEKGELSKRQEFDSKGKLSKSPPARRTSEKTGPKGKKNKHKTPLSFAAAEFLFPGEDDSSKSSSQKVPYEEDDTTSSDVMSSKLKKIKQTDDKDDSPDTDDYMDNWENDDVDLDVNLNNTCDSSTPMRSSQDDAEDEMFMTRYTNPSPPMEVLQIRKATADVKPNVTSLTQKSFSQLSETPEGTDYVKEEIEKPTHKKELFGMQEIYDQFIKSVEESGVDLKPTMSNNSQDVQLDKSLETHKDKLSTSSASTSSTSSSSSSSSSSSEASNSSSSSSSSSSSGSSSEESNDADSFKNVSLQSPKRKSKVNEITQVVVKIEKELTPPIPENPREENNSVTPKLLPVPKVEVLTHQQPTPSEIQSTPPASTANQSSTGTQQPAPKAAKDFKKLKSLEANLARIQMMRANYDSADEISEELLKMEKLFLQEKNLILLKYAKSSSAPAANVNATKSPVAPIVTGQFVPSLQQTASAAEKEAADAAAAAEANKIFDANREAIKLTISPIKLPKTPAIFEKVTGDDNEVGSQKTSADSEEVDFTEKLQKPAKEVAIVKPMMETKDSRANQRQRRSSPSRQLVDRSRSPGGYQRDRRRSTSRSRFSPQRRQRGRSLSVSPPHRRGGARYSSPARRGGATNNAFTTSQSRYRNSGRRSRSRSRSLTRQGNRRGGELSPPHRRSRRPVPGNQSQPHYRKSSGQQRTLRDSRSRSRSIPRSPPAPRSPLRPHSPRSPPSMRRRSYSRDRYSSRSPLPFKPPSPPMRRSLSPQRRSSLSPSKHSSSRRSRSHSRSRSPRSPRYDDHRRRRASSYDRHSPSLQRQYFDPSGGPMASASPYYYNLSPSRISLDARINIVLNGPPNQEGPGGGVTTYESYSNYSQYGGQYMAIPPQPDATSYNINYSANQYVPMGSNASAHPPHSHQPVYSSIPTINSGDVGMPPPFPHSNYYYNEFGAHTSAHQSTSLLKELPKATVAVQKGNVLEIVPSAELGGGNEAVTGSQNKPTPMKPTKVKKKTLSWKEEVNNRHVTSAVMRLSRENDGSSRSILKKSTAENIISNDDKPQKKKVYFEDGIYPNRDSDDEDRKIIDAKVRRKLKRLRKRHGITINADNLVKETKKEDEEEVDPALENEPPPPPPPGSPPPHLEQPIYLRPPTPTPLYYFHFDPVVHSMYVSQMERPIPPRLLNPKAMVPTPGGSMVPVQSPSNTHSPNGAAHMLSSKKELSTFAAINRSSRGNDRASPKLIPVASAQRHDTVSTLKTLPIETIHSETMQTMKSSFQAIPANLMSTPPPNVSSMVSLPPPRQSAPIGFMGMRLNNFMRLPPSPLSRGGPIPPHGGPPMAVVGVRHSYNMPPPTMMVTTGQPHQSPSSEYSPQQQQYHSLPHPSSPHMHQPPSYPGHHHTPPPHFSTQHPPPGTHSAPSHLHHQRQQSPLFVHSVPPPPLPAGRHAIAPTLEAPDAVSNQSPASAAEETNSQHQSSSSTQALVAPYNVKKQ